MSADPDRLLSYYRSKGWVLDTEEAERLAELEARIERSFEAAKTDLLEIRDRRLYRATYDSFEAYCEERWSVSRSRAYQLIDAAAVNAALVSPMVDTANPLPEPRSLSERQAREVVPQLRRDGPGAVRATVRRVQEEHGEKATASDYRRAVRGEVEPALPPPAPSARQVECPACHHKFHPKEEIR